MYRRQINAAVTPMADESPGYVSGCLWEEMVEKTCQFPVQQQGASKGRSPQETCTPVFPGTKFYKSLSSSSLMASGDCFKALLKGQEDGGKKNIWSAVTHLLPFLPLSNE